MAIRLLSSENIDGNATFTGSVGIGAAPANKLHIQQAKSGSSAENYDLLRFNLTGTGAIGDSSSIVWYSTSGTKTAGIQGISGQDNILYGEIAFNVRKYTTDSFDEVMRINNRGSVGIGGAPASDSVLTVRGADTNNKYIRTINNNGTAYFGTIADGTGVIESNTSLKFTTGSSFTERMRIDSSGNVGIGTSSPSTVLDVRNSINIGGAGQDSNIYFQQNTSNQARINYYTDNSMIFDNWNGGYYFRTTSSFTPRVTILNGGNVGIGTSSPSEILQTNKNSAGNIVGGYFTNSQANTGAESVSLAFGLNRSGGDFVRQVKAITFGAEQQWTGTPSTVDGYLAFSTVSNETVSERMRITSGGQIVFQKTDNTTLPAGSINHASNDFLYVTGGTGGASFGDDNHNTRMIVFNDDYVRFDTAGTERMRIESDGTVQITNSTSPKLQLKRGTKEYTTRVDNNNKFVIQEEGGNEFFIVESGASSNSIRIDSSGNVGIGTSSPSEKLDVSGSIAAFGDDKSIVVKSANGTINATMGAASSSAVTRGTITVRDSGITKIVLNANDNSYFNGGNVGIGTTSPARPLHVNGISTVARFQGSQTGYTQGSIVLHSGTADSPSSRGQGTYRYNEGSDICWYTGTAYSDTNKYIWARRTGVTSFATDAGEGTAQASYALMTLVGSTGNVGIGTTSPVQPLQVNGQVLFRTTTVDGGKNRFQLIPGGSSDAANLYLYYGNSGDGTLSVRINAQGNSYFNGGNVGIGTTSPSYKLDVNGTIRATADVIAYSDRRVKENIKTIDNALDKVTKLRGVSYNRKDIEDKSTKIGVIAQEVKDILPEVVDQDGDDKYSVAYGNMAGVFIEAIKELKAEIEELKKSK
jgi:hypothetical protein